MLHEAFSEDDINLQALIMFLVFEKEVLSMEDDKSKLDLYFLPKHEERMGKELTAYKKKINAKERASCFKVYTKQGETLYVYAMTELQASAFAKSLNYEPLKIVYEPDDRLMTFNNVNMKISEITKGRKAPCLLGTNDTEQKYGGDEDWTLRDTRQNKRHWGQALLYMHNRHIKRQ